MEGSTKLPIGPVVAAIAVLMAAGIGLQAERDRRMSEDRAGAQYLYVPSGEVLSRLALSYDALLADVYWIRAIQHYGGTRLSEQEEKSYDLLYPLLDITTTLDPHFNIVYRFGAIFLTEAYPDGPGRPDLAVALLEKGFRHNPDRWEYLMDIGFVHYWWLHDFGEAAAWFRRAAGVEGAPEWLPPLAATTLAQGGDRAASRTLWRQIYETAEHEWLRNSAGQRLVQLAAMDEIDQLERAVASFARAAARAPDSWTDLIAAGVLPDLPRDPAGHAYQLDGATGLVDVSPDSPLFPLPAGPAVRLPLP